MEDNIISMQNICFEVSFKDSKALILDNINLNIKKGDFVAIVGPSGSGKSSLMNIIGLLDNKSSGIYKIDNVDIDSLSSHKKAKLRCNYFGFIFQRYNLIHSLNALENVQVPTIYKGVKEKYRKERAISLLESLSLGHRLYHKPSELSGGQQQRVSIARALINGSQVILADEPTGALDSKSGHDILNILKHLNNEGTTVIIVTHDENIAKEAKRIIQISDGKITKDKRVKAIEDKLLLDSNFKDDLSNLEFNTNSLFKKSYFTIIKDSMNIALNALLYNKMKSFFCMLGIIIGIISLILVLSISRGAESKVLGSIASLGTNTISIFSGSRFSNKRHNQVQTLNFNDVKAVAKLPFVHSASPLVQSQAMFRTDKDAASAMLYGVSEKIFDVYGLKMKKGRRINEYDILYNKTYCVIDDQTEENFFKGEDALHKVVFVNDIAFEIIGVVDTRGAVFIRQNSMQVYIPHSAYMTRVYKQDYITSLVIRLKDDVSPQKALINIEDLLIKRHKEKDFFSFSSDALVKSRTQTQSTLSLLTVLVAIISLVVGGIGVMNVMLVSIKQRVKEIGIRMSVGASERDIMYQFLIESIVICLIASVLGLTLSLILVYLINAFSSNITLLLEFDAIALSVVISTLIGLIFGFMPAKKASLQNIIEALSKD